MYAYCGNNPIAREDVSGNNWLLAGIVAIGATINDICQLLRDDDEKVTTSYTSGKESVNISNSTNIVTPWVQYGYCAYLNYFSEYKDYFVGTSSEMAYEWFVHNAAYWASGALALGGDLLNVSFPGLTDIQNSCENVDIGPTLVDDYSSHSDSTKTQVMSAIMITGYAIRVFSTPANTLNYAIEMFLF